MSHSVLCIRDWDREDSLFPRWELVLTDRNHPYYPAQSSLHLKWSTRDDGKWGNRSNQHQTADLKFAPEEIDTLILAATRLPESFPAECLDHTQVHTQGGYSPTRSNESAVICRSVSFGSDGKHGNGFYIRKDSLIWNESMWGVEIMKHVTPHLVEAPWRRRMLFRKLP